MVEKIFRFEAIFHWKMVESVDGEHLKKPIHATAQPLGNTPDLFGVHRNSAYKRSFLRTKSPTGCAEALYWAKDGAKAPAVWSRISDLTPWNRPMIVGIEFWYDKTSGMIII